MLTVSSFACISEPIRLAVHFMLSISLRGLGLLGVPLEPHEENY